MDINWIDIFLFIIAVFLIAFFMISLVLYVDKIASLVGKNDKQHCSKRKKKLTNDDNNSQN